MEVAHSMVGNEQYSRLGRSLYDSPDRPVYLYHHTAQRVAKASPGFRIVGGVRCVVKVPALVADTMHFRENLNKKIPVLALKDVDS